MQKPELPPDYAIIEGTLPTVTLRGEPLTFTGDFGSEPLELGSANGAAWAHFRKHGDPAWAAFIDAQQGGRAPFDGFKGVTEEQLAAAQPMVDRWGESLVINGVGPDADTVILAAHLMQIVDHALDKDVNFNPGKKSTAIMRALFDGKTVGSEVASLMIAMLVLRLYDAPYGSLNEAAMDFVNTLLPALDTAVTSMQPRKRKHPGG